MKSDLKYYREWLFSENLKSPNSGRPETPESLKIKTLWIPTRSGNRTATIDLNHEMSQLCEEELNMYSWYVEGYTQCLGYNGNCGTAYAIIPVPMGFTEPDIDTLAIACCQKMGKNYGAGNERRVLKADERMKIIIECLNSMRF